MDILTFIARLNRFLLDWMTFLELTHLLSCPFCNCPRLSIPLVFITIVIHSLIWLRTWFESIIDCTKYNVFIHLLRFLITTLRARNLVHYISITTNVNWSLHLSYKVYAQICWWINATMYIFWLCQGGGCVYDRSVVTIPLSILFVLTVLPPGLINWN